MVRDHTSLENQACSFSPDSSRSIPLQIESELSSLGGIAGLCRRIPADEIIAREGLIHNALSDPVRLKILHLLGIRSMCVCVIRACIGISDSKLSYHISVLKKSGLIEGDQKGNLIFYSLTDEGRIYAGPGNRENYPSYYTFAD